MMQLSERCVGDDGRAKENNREYVYRVLRENIMNFWLEPGETLNENELSKMFGVSRTPVHEAITQLSGEHLVEILPQCGTFISKIDLTLLREGYSVRIFVEPHIITELAGKLLPKDLTKLDAILQKQTSVLQSGGTLQTFFGLDNLFHQQMYELNNMPHIWQSIRTLSSHFDRIRFLDAMYYTTGYLEHFIDEHKQLYALLMSGIPIGFDVQAFLVNHVSSYKKSLMALIQKFPAYFAEQMQGLA